MNRVRLIGRLLLGPIGPSAGPRGPGTPALSARGVPGRNGRRCVDGATWRRGEALDSVRRPHGHSAQRRPSGPGRGSPALSDGGVPVQRAMGPTRGALTVSGAPTDTRPSHRPARITHAGGTRMRPDRRLALLALVTLRPGRRRYAPRLARRTRSSLHYALEVDTRHPYARAAEMMRERASELTNGRLDVQVFPSAQLGGSREMVEGMQVGTAEMAMPTAAVASRVIKELEVLDLPFLFRDFAHLHALPRRRGRRRDAGRRAEEGDSRPRLLHRRDPGRVRAEGAARHGRPQGAQGPHAGGARSSPRPGARWERSRRPSRSPRCTRRCSRVSSTRARGTSSPTAPRSSTRSRPTCSTSGT